MKNMTFFYRFKFALSGLKTAWLSELSFRVQIISAVLAIGSLIVLKANLLWWAIFTIIIGAVLAAELINTALEYLLDVLHPATHPQIGKAKDCAAGAVLILSFSALILFIIFIIDSYRPFFI